VAGDDPLGLAFRGSASDHAAPERYAMPAAPTSPPAAPASPWAAGGIPDDYDPMADFLPKAQPWPAATLVLPASAPAMPAAAAPQSSAAPRATTTSLPNHLDAAQRSPAPGQPNGYAAAQPPAVPRPAVTASAAPPGHDATLEALLRGLDLPDLQTKHTGPELAELVGALLREATAGAMQTLMARSVTKRESRIERTMIGSQANNPLKFFPDPGSALSQMLSKTTGGYMKPVRAFSNAFEDLQAHELAVMAGMHAALSSILARFDPAAIEKRLEVPTVMDKMMASSRKAKMWDRLVLLYADISREADDDFQRLFGESFANAYEEQIERLHGREK
jgi:FHA domain-containing protein/type VI secretion system protein